MTRQPSHLFARRDQRFPITIPSIGIFDTGRASPCETVDLSLRGARLRFPVPIENFAGHTLEYVHFKNIARLPVGLRWIHDCEIGVVFDADARTQNRIIAVITSQVTQNHQPAQTIWAS